MKELSKLKKNDEQLYKILSLKSGQIIHNFLSQVFSKDPIEKDNFEIIEKNILNEVSLLQKNKHGEQVMNIFDDDSSEPLGSYHGSNERSRPRDRQRRKHHTIRDLCN